MIREWLQLLKNTVTQISDAFNLWENLALVQNLGKRKPKVQTRLITMDFLYYRTADTGDQMSASSEQKS